MLYIFAWEMLGNLLFVCVITPIILAHNDALGSCVVLTKQKSNDVMIDNQFKNEITANRTLGRIFPSDSFYMRDVIILTYFYNARVSRESRVNKIL